MNTSETIYAIEMAHQLYAIFDEHTDLKHTDREGLFLMQELMEEIPEDYRGYVFERFLIKLQENDVEFDASIFQQR